MFHHVDYVGLHKTSNIAQVELLENIIITFVLNLLIIMCQFVVPHRRTSHRVVQVNIQSI